MTTMMMIFLDVDKQLVVLGVDERHDCAEKTDHKRENATNIIDDDADTMMLYSHSGRVREQSSTESLDK